MPHLCPHTAALTCGAQPGTLALWRESKKKKAKYNNVIDLFGTIVFLSGKLTLVLCNTHRAKETCPDC